MKFELWQFNANKSANGHQFVSSPLNLVGRLLKRAIKTSKVGSLLTNPFKVPKSAMKSTNVWKFGWVATKLLSCGRLFPRKKLWSKWLRLSVLMALFKTSIRWQESPADFMIFEDFKDCNSYKNNIHIKLKTRLDETMYVSL